MNLIIDEKDQTAIVRALGIEKKSLERAAKAYELEGRRSTAEAVRAELATITKLSFKVQDLSEKTPQAKA